MLNIEWNNDVIHGGLSTCVLTKDLVLGVIIDALKHNRASKVMD